MHNAVVLIRLVFNDKVVIIFHSFQKKLYIQFVNDRHRYFAVEFVADGCACSEW